MFPPISRRLACIVGLGLVCTTVPCLAVTNRQRVRSKSGVANRNYGHDAVIASQRGLAVANQSIVLPNSLQKPFHFRSLNIDLAHMQLHHVGLAIDGLQGNLMASGRISHNGGDGGMKGSHVMVRIRAYAATPENASLLTPDARQIPPDAVAVWQCEQKIWVPVGDQHFTLVPTVQSTEQRQVLQNYFETITHLELELEYLRDK